MAKPWLEKIMIINYKYITFIKYLHKNTFDTFQTAQIIEFLLNANIFNDQFE